MMATFGLFKYVIPIYYYNKAYPTQDPEAITIETLDYYDYINPAGYWYELPWCQITLLFCVFLPFLMICVLSCTICIVICVYLKESIKRTFTQEEEYNEDARLSYLRRLDGLGRPNKHTELREE